MISSEEASTLVSLLNGALKTSRSPLGRSYISQARDLARILESDLTGDPNVVVRTAELSFEVTDLIPEMLAIQEGNTQP